MPHSAYKYVRLCKYSFVFASQNPSHVHSLSNSSPLFIARMHHTGDVKFNATPPGWPENTDDEKRKDILIVLCIKGMKLVFMELLHFHDKPKPSSPNEIIVSET